MRVEPVFDERTVWKLVATLPRSSTVTTFCLSRLAPLKAAIEIGTLCTLSARFWAVTIISPPAGAGLVVSAALSCAWAMVALDARMANALAQRRKCPVGISVSSPNFPLLSS